MNTIRELNQQELKLVSGGYKPNPEGPIFIPFPPQKWPFPIPHPIDPISLKPIYIDKVSH